MLNLWDQDTVTRVDNTRFAGSSTLPLDTGEFFNTNWNYEALLAADPASVDPKFNRANQFQAPRELRFTVKFEF